MRRSTRIDGSAGGEPLSCGNQSTYNRVANAGNLHRLSPFQMPFGILHNLTGKSSLTFSIEKCHFITVILPFPQYSPTEIFCDYAPVCYNDVSKTTPDGQIFPTNHARLSSISVRSYDIYIGIPICDHSAGIAEAIKALKSGILLLKRIPK